MIGVDTAAGGAKSTHRKTDANSVACVLKEEPCDQVAELSCKYEPYEFTDNIYELGRWYNDALIVVEINNHGIAVVQRLKDLGYPRLYARTIFDAFKHQWTQSLGWQTSLRTRNQLCDEARNFVSARRIRIRSRECLHEMTGFHYDDKGMPKAMPGDLDDRVFALMLAIQGLRQTMARHVELDQEEHVAAPKDKWIWEDLEDRVKRREEELSMMMEDMPW